MVRTGGIGGYFGFWQLLVCLRRALRRRIPPEAAAASAATHLNAVLAIVSSIGQVLMPLRRKCTCLYSQIRGYSHLDYFARLPILVLENVPTVRVKDPLV